MSSFLLLAAFALQYNYGDVTGSITLARWMDAHYVEVALESLYRRFGFREMWMIIPNALWFVPTAVSWVVLVALALRS